MAPENQSQETSSFERQVLLAIGTFLPIIIVIAVFWFLAEILLLIFASILLAIFLSSLTDFIGRRLHLPRLVSLFVVIVLLLGLAGIAGWQLAPRLTDQSRQLFQNLADTISQLRLQLEARAWGQAILHQMPTSRELIAGLSNVLAKTPGIISKTIGILGSFFLFLALGVYLAADPDVYKAGVIRLLPVSRRPRGKEIMDGLASILRWWLIGRIAAMSVIGVFTTLGLWLLGIPLAFVLGLIAGLFTFLPYIGPFLSFIPALLIGLSQSPASAFWVMLLYITIQTLESYFLTPQIEKRAVLLPPAVIMVAQVAMAVLLGVLGLALADPLTASISVLIQAIYINDILGDRTAIPGQNR